MPQLSVLIISDDSEFAPTIMARWQTERSVPSFSLMDTAKADDPMVAVADLVLLGGSSEALAPVLKLLEASGQATIYVVPEGAEWQRLRGEYPHIMLIREHEGWVDPVVALGSETLRRLDAIARVKRAEQALAQAQADATLGKYMLDMRHSLNNALTSVLGNSELLLLEPGAFTADVRDQIATVHNMAMRILDIVQRFTSMEMEMKFCAKSQAEMHVSDRPMAVAP
ncbi:MAG: hypothetical protein ACR2IF_17245 [Terriglobales bacterium]